MQPSIAVRKKYLLRVDNRLLMKLRMNGIDPTEAVCFFGAQAEAMLSCQPNYGPRSNRNKGRSVIDNDVWLMRGFFPGTAQMFKVSMAVTTVWPDYEYFVKVTEPVIRSIRTKNMTKGHSFIPEYNSDFNSNQIRDALQKRMENEVLDQTHGYEPLITNKTVYTPKCYSPKGMAVYRLNIKKE